MFIFTYAEAFLTIVFVVSASAFLFRQHTNPLAVALACYLLSVALWIGSNAAADVSYALPILLLTSKLAYVGGICMIFFLILLVEMFVDQKLPSGIQLTIYGTCGIVLCALGFTSLAITGVAFPSGQPAEISLGPLYSFTFLLLVGVFIYSAIRLYQGMHRESNYARRMQLLYVFTGLLITLTGQIAFDVLLPLLGVV